jgi:predicted secreted protein
VNPHAGLLDFEAAVESGPTPYAIDAAVVSATVRAADAFARVDLIWVRQDIPLEDGQAAPAVVPGYTYGTVAGTPPATPARCMVLAWVNVPASGGGSPTVTWKAPYCAGAGASIPVSSQAERDALVSYDGLSVYRLDTHVAERYNGSAWVLASPVSSLVVGPPIYGTLPGRYRTVQAAGVYTGTILGGAGELDVALGQSFDAWTGFTAIMLSAGTSVRIGSASHTASTARVQIQFGSGFQSVSNGVSVSFQVTGFVAA